MQALKNINIRDILFFDIETAIVYPELKGGTPTYDAWAYYCKNNDIEDVVGSYGKKAGLFAEYSKVICITVGVILKGGAVRIKTISGEEKSILETFKAILEAKDYYLCGHYIKGFDIPFLFKRYIIHDIDMPIALDVSDKKPWEIKHLDTADLWRGGAWSRSTLVSICLALGIDSPKAEFDGSDVSRIYHEGGIDKIALYCERDVEALIKVYKRLI